VGDWMKWNAMLDSRSLGAALVESLETQGVLNNGRKISYALGLAVREYKGLKDVSHGGSTAGYQTFLVRYPENKISIGVLCNGTSPNAGGIARSMTDEIFGPFSENPGSEAVKLSADELKKFVSIWRSEKTHFPGRLVIENGVPFWSGARLVPTGNGQFTFGANQLKFALDKDGNPVSAETIDEEGQITRYTPEKEWTPTPEELASFKGNWFSDEAAATLTFAVERDKAFMTQRPATKLALRPIYKDHFTVQAYVIWFTRDKTGKVDSMHIGTPRMRDMPFARVKE